MLSGECESAGKEVQTVPERGGPWRPGAGRIRPRATDEGTGSQGEQGLPATLASGPPSLGLGFLRCFSYSKGPLPARLRGPF